MHENRMRDGLLNFRIRLFFWKVGNFENIGFVADSAEFLAKGIFRKVTQLNSKKTCVAYIKNKKSYYDVMGHCGQNIAIAHVCISFL